MNLPTPNAQDITDFQALYKRLYGVELSRKDAQAMYTDLVQFYYLIGGHEVRHLRAQKQQQRGQAGAVH